MFFGDNYSGDVQAPSQNPNWDGIAILEELITLYPQEYANIEKNSPLSPIDADLFSTDKYWSNYFIHNNKKNYFVSEMSKSARYAIPLIKHISHIMDWE